jgi:hypothetical protein
VSATQRWNQPFQGVMVGIDRFLVVCRLWLLPPLSARGWRGILGALACPLQDALGDTPAFTTWILMLLLLLG